MFLIAREGGREVLWLSAGENLCATSSTFAGRRHMIGKVVTGCVAILPYHTATQDRGSECRDFGFISRIVTALSRSFDCFTCKSETRLKHFFHVNFSPKALLPNEPNSAVIQNRGFPWNGTCPIPSDPSLPQQSCYTCAPQYYSLLQYTIKSTFFHPLISNCLRDRFYTCDQMCKMRHKNMMESKRNTFLVKKILKKNNN